MTKHTVGIKVATLLLTMMICTSALAEPLSESIPSELTRWRAWVLHDHEEALCPSHYNDGALVRCQWPSQLEVSIDEDSGRFVQRWQIFSPGWVPLPGTAKLWPQSVQVDGRSAAVISRNQIPSVHLTQGTHQIKGQFSWPRMPEMIHVPPASGLLSLTIEGRKINAPVIDARGRLWLQEQNKSATEEDRMAVRIYRLINDAIPMQVTTQVHLDVSGQAREIGLEGLLLSGAVPMRLDSRLPVRLDGAGRLLIQARPGRWHVSITTRMPESVHKISVPQVPYGDEIWSFQPQHHLRMVTLSGASQIEPSRTEMPDQWQQFSAYLIKANTTLEFKENRRGDPDPAPDQLSLHRRWWLDFNGGGFTLHDKIEGTLNRQWFLAVNAPMALGRVAIDGSDQVITAQGDARKAGVELRRGQLKLQADARLAERRLTMAVAGWDHDFQKVSGQLHLPPGWRLLAAPGIDHVSDTWMKDWSLLDFFLVLIIALAVYKLRGWKWGLLALATMVLIFNELGAPRLVWLHILAVMALMPLLPTGWPKRLVSWWGVAAGVVLLLVTIPFVANQVRWGFYPQLALQYQHGRAADFTLGGFGMAKNQMVMEAEAPAPQAVAPKAGRDLLRSTMSRPEEDMAVTPKSDLVILQRDPDALIPTGPGLPEWQWRTVSMGWSGPVAKDQSMRLYLISPLVNLILSLVRVGLLVWLIWGVLDWRPWLQKIQQKIHSKAMAAGLLLLALVGIQAVDAHAEQGVFPPANLLEAYRQRLLEPADCLPHCADISRLELAVSEDILQMMLKIHAAGPTAVPLPVNRKSWTPSEIMLNNAPISGLARDKGGTLWAVVPPGSHTVILRGSVADDGMVLIPLPLKPHQAGFVAKGWSVKGILPDGSVGSSIQLNRLHAKGRAMKNLSNKSAMPSFLQIERVLHMGLTWQVRTTIRRLTPVGTPVVANVPLLAHESVTTAGLHVDQGAVLVNMSADQRQLSYVSTLDILEKIELKAPRAVPWTETWVLDASPIWHCELSGIAPIHHQDGAGQWQPRWQPWPGDTVTIDVERPQALEGQTVTIQQVQLVLTPGQRFSTGELELKISTSRGGQHAVALPDKSNLQEVRVDGNSLPIRQDGQWVTVPLQPGIQTVSVKWHQVSSFGVFFKAPALKIGQEAVNAKVTLNIPNRWILFVGGPSWGPAVLFWSYLVVVVIAALGLGRLTLTPLKSWHWLLLGLGMTQIPVVMALIIVGWLLVLGLREHQSMPRYWLGYNTLQLGLFFWSVVALVCLFAAVKAGLGDQPEMQIAGNNSYGGLLHWNQDRVVEAMPQPWMLSLPVWVYRGLMLAWSLWLALSLLGWLKWGWNCFAKNGVWKKKPPKVKKATAALPK